MKHSCVRPRRASQLVSVLQARGSRGIGHGGQSWRRGVSQDNHVVPLRAGACSASISGLAVFGRASRAGGSEHAQRASVDRGGASRRRESKSILQNERTSIIASGGVAELPIGTGRHWRVTALGSCRWKASFRLLGIRVKTRRFERKSGSASSPSDPMEGFDVHRVVEACSASGRTACRRRERVAVGRVARQWRRVVACGSVSGVRWRHLVLWT